MPTRNPSLPPPPPRPLEDELSRAGIRPRQFRADARLPVITAASTGGRIYYTKNLAIGGLFLLTEDRWHVGSSVDLTVRFDHVEMPVKARVTHMQSDGVGLSFTDPSDELVVGLRRVLNAHVDPVELEGFNSLKRTMFRKLSERMRVTWTYENERYDAVLRELSDEGLFLDTEIVPPFDAKVFVYLPAVLAEGIALQATELRGTHAKVIFRDASQFGATFVNASAEFRMAVRGLLQK